jgi:hypothetical protein
MEPEPKGSARSHARRKLTTTHAVAQVKDMLQQRIQNLQRALAGLGEEAAALKSEAQARPMSILTGTLDRVIRMEARERDRKTSRAKQRRISNAARSAELTRRLDELCASSPADAPGKTADPGREA